MKFPKNMVAGNWKMNGLKASIAEFTGLENLIETKETPDCEILICPPFTLIASLASVSKGLSAVGAQDCHTQMSGANTGDVSADMIKDAGGRYIIVGHSERRADHGESSALVAEKALAVYKSGLKAIICIGETEAERDSGRAEEVVLGQLAESLPDLATPDNTIVSYEPVWAIGTGKTPTTADIAAIHTALRHALVARFGASGEAFSLLYGGSVNAQNAKELMAAANVNGALVGGASLKASDFDGIIDAYRAK